MKTSQDIPQEGRSIHGGAMKRSGSTVHIILPCFLAHGGGRDIPKVLAERRILFFYQSLRIFLLKECRLMPA